MTQVEFENQLRELRGQKAQVMNQFSLMQNELKEEIAAKNRQIHELSEQVQKLKVQKFGITERRLKAEKEWNDRIQKYITDFHEQYERSWDSISTYTIVKELRKRGWQGTIFNNDPDMAEEHKDGVIAAFNGKPNEEIDYEDLERQPNLMCWHDAKFKPRTGMYLVHSLWGGKPFCFTASYDEETDEWRQWDDIQVVGQPLDEVQRANITHWMPIQDPGHDGEASESV